ncbi:MAG: MFS transporter [Spirochaetia bacterium]
MAQSLHDDQPRWNSLPLRHIGSFWLLIAAQFVEQFADALNLLLLLALMRAAFADDTLLANQALFIPMFIPIILLGPVAGVFVDRHSRRGWMLTAAAGRFVFIGVMALLARPLLAGSRAALGGTIGAILAVSSLWQFYNPARSAALPEVVPAARLAVANSVSITILLIMQIVGYVMGGILGDNIDLSKALAVNAGLYLGTLLLLSVIRFHPSGDHVFHPLSFRQIWKELWAALRLLFSRAAHLRGSLVKVIGLAVLTGVSFTAMQGFAQELTSGWLAGTETFLKSRLGIALGPLSRFTFLLLAAGLGAGLGIVLLGWLKDHVSQNLLIQCALLLAAGSFLLVSMSRTFSQAVLGMVGTGWGAGLVLALVEARIQIWIPAHARGKALSAYFLLRNGVVILGVSALPKVLGTLTGPDPRLLLNYAAWGAVFFGVATAVAGAIHRRT